MVLNLIRGQRKKPAPQNNKRRVVDKNKLLHDLITKQCLFNKRETAELQEGNEKERRKGGMERDKEGSNEGKEEKRGKLEWEMN